MFGAIFLLIFGVGVLIYFLIKAIFNNNGYDPSEKITVSYKFKVPGRFPFNEVRDCIFSAPNVDLLKQFKEKLLKEASPGEIDDIYYQMIDRQIEYIEGGRKGYAPYFMDPSADLTDVKIPSFQFPKKKSRHKMAISMDVIEFKEIPSDLLIPKQEISLIDNMFARKKVVFTGNLDNFPYREDVAQLLFDLGADVDTALSERTDFVIIGEDPGPKKLMEIRVLTKMGKLKIIREDELLQHIEEFNSEKVSNELRTSLRNTQVAFTGEFQIRTASNWKLVIEDFGGEAQKNLNLQTDILVVGKDPNHDWITKAKGWNHNKKCQIQIIKEDQLTKLIDGFISES